MITVILLTTNAALVLVNLDGFGNTIGELLDSNNLFEIAGHGETTQSYKNSNLYKILFFKYLRRNINYTSILYIVSIFISVLLGFAHVPVGSTGENWRGFVFSL